MTQTAIPDRFENEYLRRFYTIHADETEIILRELCQKLDATFQQLFPGSAPEIFVGMETSQALRWRIAPAELELVIGNVKLTEFCEVLQKLGTLQRRSHQPTPVYNWILHPEASPYSQATGKELRVAVRRPLTYLRKPEVFGILTTGFRFYSSEDVYFYPQTLGCQHLAPAYFFYDRQNPTHLRLEHFGRKGETLPHYTTSTPSALLLRTLWEADQGVKDAHLERDWEAAREATQELVSWTGEGTDIDGADERLRMREFFWRLLSTRFPSRVFQRLQEIGVLADLFPELHTCVGCQQNPKHHSHPVFEHLLFSLDAACAITPRMDVRFAALLHDIGKPETRRLRADAVRADDWVFDRHELASASQSFQFFRRWKFPLPFSQQVIHLVRHHQYNYTRDWKDKAVKNFVQKVGISPVYKDRLSSHPLFLLRQADRRGNDLKRGIPITEKQFAFQGRIQQLFEGGM